MSNATLNVNMNADLSGRILVSKRTGEQFRVISTSRDAQMYLMNVRVVSETDASADALDIPAVEFDNWALA